MCSFCISICLLLQIAVYSVLTQPLHATAAAEDCLERYGSDWETIIIMERADKGSLEEQRKNLTSLLKKDRVRGYAAILDCLLDVVYGLEYLHDLGITHGESFTPHLQFTFPIMTQSTGQLKDLIQVLVHRRGGSCRRPKAGQ